MLEVRRRFLVGSRWPSMLMLVRSYRESFFFSNVHCPVSPDLTAKSCVLLKRKKQKARPKGVNLKVRWRAKVAMRCCSEESAHRAILVWECRDRPPRRSVGKGPEVLVCVHAVTIQHRGRATRSIDHNTHGHRLGQDKAQAGFEGREKVGFTEKTAKGQPGSGITIRTRMELAHFC